MDKYCFHSCERPPIYYNFLLLPRIMSQRGRNSIPFLPHSITERHPLSPLTHSLVAVLQYGGPVHQPVSNSTTTHSLCIHCPLVLSLWKGSPTPSKATIWIVVLDSGFTIKGIHDMRVSYYSTGQSSIHRPTQYTQRLLVVAINTIQSAIRMTQTAVTQWLKGGWEEGPEL